MIKSVSICVIVIFALLFSLLGSVLTVTPARAAGFTVNTTNDTNDTSPGDGLCADSAGHCSLRAAMQEANALSGADTITLQDGTYTLSLGSQLPAVTTSMTVTGNGESNTILQASTCNPVILPDGCTPAHYRVLEVRSTGSLTLENLTIKHGSCVEQSPKGYCESETPYDFNGSLSGGGIYNEGALSTSHVTLSSNAARYYAGGIYSIGSSLTLTNSTILENSSIHYAGGIYTTGGDPTMDHVTFSGNYAGDFGGGLFSEGNSPALTYVTFNGNSTYGSGGGWINYSGGGNPTLTDGTFRDNSAGSGGGFISFSGTPTLTRVTFSGNTSTGGDGGGLLSADGMTLVDVTFDGNQALKGSGGGMNVGSFSATNLTFINNSSFRDGGGMFYYPLSSSSSSLTNATFSGNSSSMEDGGGLASFGNLTLANATFSGNSAYYTGGGMYTEGDSTILTNVTLSGNSASDSGGGIYVSSGSTFLNNVTLSGNSAAFGGGIFNNSALTLQNVIIANSINGGDCLNYFILQSYANTLIESTGKDACDLTNGSYGNIIGSDPNLGTLANNGGFNQTHALLPGSPAIDAGTNCAATDQRGVSRPLGAACDIGAFESGAVIPVIASSEPSTNAVLSSLSSLSITFTQNMKSDASSQAANYTANYLLVERGPNGSFDTLSCDAGLASDDVEQTLSSAAYNSNTFTASLTTASPLADGTYRLFICGTTSIWSEAGLELNNGASDTLVNFTVATPVTTVSSLPKTGFPPNKQTRLPPQPIDLKYGSLGEIRLEIPELGVNSTIVGVPQSPDLTWDVTWLGNTIGWLNGTAFPTWNGNSVLTAHVTNSSGTNGPFAAVKSLQYGDQVIVHMDGLKYIFEVRTTKLARPNSTGYAFQSMQDHAYLTLITCQGYNPISQSYLFRRVVRAVLMQVVNE